MPRPRLTEQEKTAMRERILDAAGCVLHEHGPDGLSIRAIAEQVGVSHMVLYTYFENRDALFSALRDRHSQQIRERHNEYLARAKDGSVYDVMREMLHGYGRFARRRPRAFRFLWGSLLTGEDRMLKPPHEGLHEELHYLSRLIRLGIERGEFSVDDPLAAAAVVLGQISGTQILLQLPDEFDAPMQERIQTEIVDAAMAYLTDQRE